MKVLYYAGHIATMKKIQKNVIFTEGLHAESRHEITIFLWMSGEK